jgi:hypothetical protein
MTLPPGSPVSSLPLSDIGEWLESEIAAGDPGHTAVLAGHYAIFTGGAAAVDMLDRREPTGGPAEMLQFTKFTWRVACQAVAAQRKHRAQLLVLVDDVQFVIPMVEDRRSQERLADALVSQYLQSTPTLPRFHSGQLSMHSLDESDVFKHSAARWIFSERELRIAHVRRLKELMKSGAQHDGLSASPDLSRITYTSAEHGEYCLVHSGRTTCAGGYVELLCAAQERGVRRLITLVPMRCLGPITVGNALGANLLTNGALSVTNVAIPDVASGAAAAVSSRGFAGTRPAR